jgi:YHS domain-containing protein
MKLSRRTYLIAGLLAVVGAAGVAVWTVGSDARGKGQINTIGSPGVAIKGYDPVAYFTEGKPEKGSKAHSYQYKGAEWRFASEANKAKFAADPGKYEPAYGGYCAYGVASGYLVKIEGNAWSIKDGKLYLNYDTGVQEKWSKDPKGYIEKANGRWPKLIGQ